MKKRVFSGIQACGFRDNWDALVAVVREGERNSRARSDFNAAVASALDSAVRLDAAKDAA